MRLYRVNSCAWGGLFFFFQAEDGIRDLTVTGVQTCALPIWALVHRPEKARGWLFVVAANMARDEARRAAREKRHLTLLKSESDFVHGSPEEAIDADTQRTHVRAALEQLTPRDREALLLWDSGLSYDEIAAQTGLARGAVGTTLARARRRLVEAYDAGLAGGGQHVARG